MYTTGKHRVRIYLCVFKISKPSDSQQTTLIVSKREYGWNGTKNNKYYRKIWG